MDAWFPFEKLGFSGDWGQVEMTPYGLQVTPPAKARAQLAIFLVGVSTGRIPLTTPKGDSYIIPYAGIKDLRTVKVRWPQRSIIELDIVDEKNVLQTLKFAPCKGKLPVKYKTAEFYEELVSKVSEARKTLA